jgi:hypothetical protein
VQGVQAGFEMVASLSNTSVYRISFAGRWTYASKAARACSYSKAAFSFARTRLVSNGLAGVV